MEDKLLEALADTARFMGLYTAGVGLFGAIGTSLSYRKHFVDELMPYYEEGIINKKPTLLNIYRIQRPYFETQEVYDSAMEKINQRKHA